MQLNAKLSAVRRRMVRAVKAFSIYFGSGDFGRNHCHVHRLCIRPEAYSGVAILWSEASVSGQGGSRGVGRTARGKGQDTDHGRFANLRMRSFFDLIVGRAQYLCRYGYGGICDANGPWICRRLPQNSEKKQQGPGGQVQVDRPSRHRWHSPVPFVRTTRRNLDRSSGKGSRKLVRDAGAMGPFLQGRSSGRDEPLSCFHPFPADPLRIQQCHKPDRWTGRLGHWLYRDGRLDLWNHGVCIGKFLDRGISAGQLGAGDG